MMEEVEVTRDTSRDLHILIAADALQADDMLIDTTMAAALAQSNPAWTEAVNFLVQIIGNRLPVKGSDNPLGILPDTMAIDVHLLSPGAKNAVVNIYTSHVLTKLPSSGDFQIGSPEFNATSWVVYFFLSSYTTGVRVPFGSHLVRRLLTAMGRHCRSEISSPSEHPRTISSHYLAMFLVFIMISVCD